jgi:UDP-glucuronate 4-epimerase
MSQKLILVTGAAGFIGFHLIKSLIKLGESVVGVDNINNYYDPKLKFDRLNEVGIDKSEIVWNSETYSKKYDNFCFIRLNIEDSDELFKICNKWKFDFIIHLAAQAGVRYSLENPSAYIQSNLVGFGNILEASRMLKVKHLIFASSSSVYGMNKKTPFSTSDNVDHPISLYAATKKSNELMAYTYSHLFNIPSTGLRFFTVYGPWGRPDMAYFSFTKKILDGEPIDIYNNGEMMRDFTFIDDIVEGIEKILNYSKSNTNNIDLIFVKEEIKLDSSPVPYKIYNIGNNQPIKLRRFISAIEQSCKKKAFENLLPMQPGDVPVTFADVDDLIRDFGFKPNTSIEEGIKRFVAWYKLYYNIT